MSRLARHFPVAHAARHDLLRSLRDDVVPEPRGTPTRMERGGRACWYDSYRVGTNVRQACIGEDDEELRARLARIKELRAARNDRLDGRSRLIRILRAEGFLSIDAATCWRPSPMPASSGSAARVGTIAVRHYKRELGLRHGFDEAARTNDIDIASFERLCLALEDRPEDLREAYQDAIARGPHWRERLAATLKRMPETAKRLETL